ncbi:MAG: glycosyltransferase family 2 protein [Pseudomonadota bacterium]
MNIPVALFLFKRKDTLARIFAEIRKAQPAKVYLLGDGPRSEQEAEAVAAVRNYAVAQVDWDCQVVTRFPEHNVGVYQNIGAGAQWVLEREESAIFLEDDNLPAPTFFRFCRELLDKYRDDSRVLWICGTNYLQEYRNSSADSYMFTRHLLPCGWATWSAKFLSSYDGGLRLLCRESEQVVRSTYTDLRLYRQEIDVIRKTKRLLEVDEKRASWDRQMQFSVRANSQFGISPAVNQIRNIGVDEHSTHGGNSLRKTMTARFCEIPTGALEFPLRHPHFVAPDPGYEKLLGETILYPLRQRILLRIMRFLKPLLGLRTDESLVLKLRKIRETSNAKRN